jgi:hypothetical protein
MLKWLLDVSLAWAFKFGVFYVHKSDLTIVAGVLRLLGTYLNLYREKEGFEVRVPKDDAMRDLLSNFCLFSVVWGVGGALEEKTRKGYSELVLKLITAAADIPEAFHIKAELIYPFVPNSVPAKLPEKVPIFDLCFTNNFDWK